MLNLYCPDLTMHKFGNKMKRLILDNDFFTAKSMTYSLLTISWHSLTVIAQGFLQLHYSVLINILSYYPLHVPVIACAN